MGDKIYNEIVFQIKMSLPFFQDTIMKHKHWWMKLMIMGTENQIVKYIKCYGLSGGPEGGQGYMRSASL